ncbi:hypothetical protein [Thermoplasma sp.]|uniref:hypothetical protein n=1 Tax=Thermoplasma sp. TaxID=1973142 RepID=UPI00127731F7|nr:hypothetical protein [Thermoplasma sp.]KAA8922293.1 MAG: hypothetical protein F6Q11_05275 [Thermoplasma sp.]
MEIRRIVDPDQIDGFLNVIRSAWKTDSVDGAFRDTIASMRYHGGLLLGAFDDDGRIIGMSFGYPGFRNGKVYLYSHMAGVVEGRKYSNVGYSLKMKQRELAGSMGYDLIAWTFDPFNPLNAYFNISKLGAITRTYIKNFYGTMNDGINRGMRTDRVVAEWWIKLPIDRECNDIVFVNDADRYTDIRIPAETGCLGFYVPPSVSYFTEDRASGSELKNAAAETFNHLFSMGFSIVHYEKGKSNYFIFKKLENIKTKVFDSNVE